MPTTSHTIRVVDEGQSRRPEFWKQIALIILGPGALMWPGALMGIPAMQWAGFVLFLIILLMSVSRWLDAYVTPDEARKKIDDIERQIDADEPKPT